MRATTRSTSKVSRATRADMMFELSPLVTAANAPARSIPASLSVSRSKPKPSIGDPAEAGRQAAERRLALVDDRDRVAGLLEQPGQLAADPAAPHDDDVHCISRATGQRSVSVAPRPVPLVVRARATVSEPGSDLSGPHDERNDRAMAFRRMFERLRAPIEDLDRAALREWTSRLGSTPIAEVVPRQPTVVAGEASSVRIVPRAGSPSLEVTVTDGTGFATGVFLGRRRIAGHHAGSAPPVRGGRVPHGAHHRDLQPALRHPPVSAIDLRVDGVTDATSGMLTRSSARAPEERG